MLAESILGNIPRKVEGLHLAVSATGSVRYAWVLPEGARSSYLLDDGTRIPEGASDFAFSPSGSAHAYLVGSRLVVDGGFTLDRVAGFEWRDDDSRWVASLRDASGACRLLTSHGLHPYDFSCWCRFSSDGGHVFYVAHGDRWMSCLVKDRTIVYDGSVLGYSLCEGLHEVVLVGIPKRGRRRFPDLDDPARVVRGKEMLESIPASLAYDFFTLRTSSDAGFIQYVVRESNGSKVFVISNGEASRAWRRVQRDSQCMTDDGKVWAYVGVASGYRHVVANGEIRYRSRSRIEGLVLTRKGTACFSEHDGAGSTVHVGDTRHVHGSAVVPGSIVVSPDGSRALYLLEGVSRSGKGNCSLVVNGDIIATYDRVFVPYKGAGCAPWVSPDGRRCVFLATKGSKLMQVTFALSP